VKNNVALVYPEGVVKASGDIVGRGGERWGARRWLWAIDNELIQCLIGGQCRYSLSDLQNIPTPPSGYQFSIIYR